LKKSSVRFFQKQPVFFCKRPAPEKMHKYAVSVSTKRREKQLEELQKTEETKMPIDLFDGQDA
jgi:hypothetical protein